MEDNHFLDAGLLDRYLAGDGGLSQAEGAQVEAWIAGESCRANVLWAIKDGGEYVDASEMWQRFKARELQSTSSIASGKRGVYSGRALRGWVRYGAVASLALFLAVAATTGIFKRFMTITDPIESEYHTGIGQQAVIQLADGSKAVLAPLTTLRFQSARSVRSATVDGQVLFTVTQSEGMPFTVRVGNVTTRVLGTTFDVRRYENDTTVRVIVAEGKVASGDAILATGDVAIVRNDGHASVHHGQNVSQAVAWSQGMLAFTDTPLEEVLAECERWYGLKFRVDSKTLAQQPVTAVIARESANAVVDKLAIILGASANRVGNVVTFTWRTE